MLLPDLLARVVLVDPPDPQHNPADVRELADEILSRPEYREPSKSLFERIQDAISNFMSDFFSALGFGGGGGGSVLAWLVLVALLAIVGVLVAWGVKAWSPGRRVRIKDGEDPLVFDAEEGKPSRSWLREAEEHEAAGRWRHGLLCRYRALVTALVEDELIPATPGRTAGEYVRDVRERVEDEAVVAAFTAATDLFETAWYGGVETGPAERDEFVRLAGRVLDRSRV
jgi:uncharacterized protein DUF4129